MTAVALDFDVELMAVAPRLPALNAAGRLNLPVALPGEPICVVASADRGLRRRLAAAAELAGWTAHEGGVDGAPLSSILRHGPELVVLDLVDPVGGDRDALEAFARTVAARPTSCSSSAVPPTTWITKCWPASSGPSSTSRGFRMATPW